MSILTHNCTCGHPTITHIRTEKGRELCSRRGCDCIAISEAESIVMETFNWQRDPMPLHAPGTGDGRMAGVASCACNNCAALYEARQR